jgi:hypothetical protein
VKPSRSSHEALTWSRLGESNPRPTHYEAGRELSSRVRRGPVCTSGAGPGRDRTAVDDLELLPEFRHDVDLDRAVTDAGDGTTFYRLVVAPAMRWSTTRSRPPARWWMLRPGAPSRCPPRSRSSPRRTSGPFSYPPPARPCPSCGTGRPCTHAETGSTTCASTSCPRLCPARRAHGPRCGSPWARPRSTSAPIGTSRSRRARAVAAAGPAARLGAGFGAGAPRPRPTRGSSVAPASRCRPPPPATNPNGYVIG